MTSLEICRRFIIRPQSEQLADASFKGNDESGSVCSMSWTKSVLLARNRLIRLLRRKLRVDWTARLSWLPRPRSASCPTCSPNTSCSGPPPRIITGFPSFQQTLSPLSNKMLDDFPTHDPSAWTPAVRCRIITEYFCKLFPAFLPPATLHLRP